MKITWAGASYPLSATRLPYRDGELVIEQKHFDIWQQHPDAVYEVVVGGTGTDGVKRYVLGAWERP